MDTPFTSRDRFAAFAASLGLDQRGSHGRHHHHGHRHHHHDAFRAFAGRHATMRAMWAEASQSRDAPDDAGNDRPWYEHGGPDADRRHRRHHGDGRGLGDRHGRRGPGGPGFGRGGPGFGGRRWGFGGPGFGPGGPGFGPGGPAGPGGRERFFERGELRYVILSLINDTPRHGYDIIRALEDQFSGFYSPSPGTVYPTLQLLEDQGLVTSNEQDGKKVYQATDEGRAEVEKRADMLAAIRDRLAGRGGFGALADVRPLVGDLWELGQTIVQAAARGHGNPERIARLREIVARTRDEVEAVLNAPPTESDGDGKQDVTPTGEPTSPVM